MKAATHTVGALAAGSAAIYFNGAPQAVEQDIVQAAVFIGSLMLGGLLPDICQPNSWMGRRLRATSYLVFKLVGHRTLTHSLVGTAIVFILTGLIPGLTGTVIQTGITAGVISHIFLDMLTPKGVHLFFPVRYNVRFPFGKLTGSRPGEFLIFMLLSFFFINGVWQVIG